MPAPLAQQDIKELPLGLVGSNKFGRYSKISAEQTVNFIISDDALVPYAGYKAVVLQSASSEGRGIYSSSRGNLMIAVWGSAVYRITQGLVADLVGNLGSSSGDVYMSENNNGEIAISDGTANTLYVVTWAGPGGVVLPLPSFATVTLPFVKSPGYISFQNGQFILVNQGTTNWYLSGFNDAKTVGVKGWGTLGYQVGSLQSKPDTVQAAVPIPGGGNNMLLFGHTVAEPWNYTGGALFPFQRYSTNNIDYGCLNPSSIAALDNYIVWLSANEQSGATVMIYSGTSAKSISTDGIDFKLAGLTNPNNCTGFLYRQDGHVLYQFTFPDNNLSYIYDINTGAFFTVTDENLNYHVARNVVYFNGNYYFVSLNGGNLYQFGTQYTNADYGPGMVHVIPRIRVLPPMRLPSQRMFILKSLGFTIENGQPNTITTYPGLTEQQGGELSTEGVIQIATEGGVVLATEGPLITVLSTYELASENVDLSISRDGGETFGSSLRLPMNATGKRKSRFIFQRLGQANDATMQLRFSGQGRFVVFEGEVEVYT